MDWRSRASDGPNVQRICSKLYSRAFRTPPTLSLPSQPAVWLAAQDLEGDTAAGAEIGHFREYVRPVESQAGSPTRQISDFCNSLTGITQADVDAAAPLAEVIDHFVAWLQERGLVTALEEGRAVLVAHGGWDLGDQLPRECARKGIALPAIFNSHADLKVVFALTCPENRGTSLKQMLDYLSIPAQGRQHSGLDDCRNFGRILAQLLNLGADISPTYESGIGQLRGHGVGKRPGDWDCPCGAVAFGSKSACYRCGEPRPAHLAPPVRLHKSNIRNERGTSPMQRPQPRSCGRYLPHRWRTTRARRTSHAALATGTAPRALPSSSRPRCVASNAWRLGLRISRRLWPLGSPG